MRACVCLCTRVKVPMHLFVAPAAMSIAISIVLTLSHFGFHITLSNLIVISVHGRCSLHRKSSISLLLFSWLSRFTIVVAVSFSRPFLFPWIVLDGAFLFGHSDVYIPLFFP